MNNLLQVSLGALVSDFWVEASRHPDTKAILIREQAAVLDAVRVRVILERTSDAVGWAHVDEARRILADHILARCLTDHPARDIIRRRAR